NAIQSSEANAWTSVNNGSWKEALVHAKDWYVDQPFSSRPAILAGYIACTAFDAYADAEQIFSNSLFSNNDDVMLRNNLAFVLAQQGRTEEASEVLIPVDPTNVQGVSLICITATLGLIAFRAQDFELGRKMYRKA